MTAAAGAAGRAATSGDTGGTAAVSARQMMRAIVQAGYGSADVSPLARLRRALTAAGTLVLVGGEDGGRWTGMSRQLRALARSPFTRQRLTMLISQQRRADLETLARLIDAGQLTPVIGKTYPLRQAPDAMRDLQAGHARGKLVLTMTDAG